MKKIKSLKSFTILEALISLMLMSIIIAVSYALFNLIGKQLSLFNKEHAQVLEYNLFNSAIIRDIENANDYNMINDELILKKYDETQISYIIRNHYILRQNDIKTDTFTLQTINYKLINNTTPNILQKALQIKLNVLQDTITTHYALNKDNSEVINLKYFNED
ncbi:hypothetical protein [uncultured Algibacter sp.]|uniref:hypothetical protein n=1 Tax=uncultured Algibacter sp. TaxID=298659 RepID=UPI00321796A8